MLNSVNIDPALVRMSVIEMLYRGKASHLGSNMSAIEMLIAMYSSVNKSLIINQDPDRSRIFISKGHCAAATYATMAHVGIIPISLLDEYHSEGSELTGHVSHEVFGVEHSTGALGHGINVAVGAAIGLQSRGHKDRLVLSLVGDGEIQEGSVWEAMMFAVHKKLNNLITLVDNNGISSITNTEKVVDMRPLASRFKGFGLNVYQVDGHDVLAIMEAIDRLKNGNLPGVIICETVKGRDIPFAEHEPIWHYKSLSQEQYAEAIAHLKRLRVGQ